MITLRASSAPRWVPCSYSTVTLPNQHPDEDIDAAREGTCAAWVAECAINDDVNPFDLIGETHENGWVVDADMARHANGYVKTLSKRAQLTAEHYREVQVTPGLKIAGTLDAQSFERRDDDTWWLCIDDLKYGFDIVEPTSWQLVTYMMLAFQTGDIQGWMNGVSLGIYQPRALHYRGHYRRVHLTMETAKAQMTHVLKRAQQIAENPMWASAGFHCAHCPKAHLCETLGHRVYNATRETREAYHIDPTGQQIADELKMLNEAEKLIKIRKTAVKAEVEGRLANGKAVPGWARVPRVGKKQFRFPGEVIEAMTGVSPWEDRKLCTPAELIRRKVPEETVNKLSRVPYVGHTLEEVTSEMIEDQFK